jgi:hypothetical protein
MTPTTNTASHQVYRILTENIPTIGMLDSLLDHLRKFRSVEYSSLQNQFPGFVGSLLIETIAAAGKAKVVRSHVVGPTMFVQWIGD